MKRPALQYIRSSFTWGMLKLDQTELQFLVGRLDDSISQGFFTKFLVGGFAFEDDFSPCH